MVKKRKSVELSLILVYVTKRYAVMCGETADAYHSLQS